MIYYVYMIRTCNTSQSNIGNKWVLVIPFLYFKINKISDASDSKLMWHDSTCLSIKFIDLNTAIALCKVGILLFVTLRYNEILLPSLKFYISMHHFLVNRHKRNMKNNFWGM